MCSLAASRVHSGCSNLVDTAAMLAHTKPLLERLGADFEPDTPVAALSLAQRQLVEIAKALSLGAEIVIMDEPTSSLTMTETNRLLEIIAELKAAGVSVIFITHRLNEIEQCADRVVALRDGRVVGTLQRGEIEHDRMIRLMIGRDLKALYTPPKGAVGQEILVSKDIRTTTYPDCPVSFSLRRGEIVGLAGLVGSGRSELARTIFGIDRPAGGSIEIDGRPLTVQSPRDAIAHGIYLIPEDRKRAGLILEDDITSNISLPNLRQFASWRGFWIAIASSKQRSNRPGGSTSARRRWRAWRERCPAAISRKWCLPNGWRCRPT